MKLYATGFNAWNQLDFHPFNDKRQQQPSDLHELIHTLSDTTILAVEPYLTYTHVETGSGSKTAGVVPQEHVALRERFGRFSLAANNSIIVPVGKSHIGQYESIYLALSAYDVGFAVLTVAGEVWTWGDNRYPGCLGREVSTTSPASLPGRVTDLDELPTGKIVKIVAGGYMLAAITSGHDMYCWGGHPGRKQAIDSVLPSVRPIPVVVEDGSDIIDVALGDSHAIVLTDKGDIFVAGENSNGQLGIIGSTAQPNCPWTKISLPLSQGTPIRVIAGPRASFVVTR